MFGNLAEFFHEIAAEIGTEVVQSPVTLIAEVVQFALLLSIIWVVAIGFGRRRGFVANMLTERQERTSARLESASHAESTLEESKRQVASMTRAGRSEAREMITQAKLECAEIGASARSETDADCSRIAERAESALATEQQEMLLELREQLVELVSSSTRSIMNEKLTVSEQRKLIENTIVGTMNASAGSDARLEALAAGSVPEGA